MLSTVSGWLLWVRSWQHLLWIELVVVGRFVCWRMEIGQRQFRRTESAYTCMKQTLLLVRHGQTVWNVEHRLPGQLAGVALNETGRQQAARLAEALLVLPISAIISSPLERAHDTAEILARGRNLDVQHEPDLMDTNIGPWAGQIIEELSKNDPAWKAYTRDPTTAPEGVETFPQVQQRAVAAVERWRTQEGSGAHVVFVAHADVVKLLVAHYTGLEVGRAGSLMIDNASVSLIELEGEPVQPRVVSIGWNPQPGWLKAPKLEEVKGSSVAQEQGEQKT